MEQNSDIKPENKQIEESKELPKQPEEKIQKPSVYKESEINEVKVTEDLTPVRLKII